MSAKLKMRVNQLDKFISMLNEMEILIKFRAMRTYEIIKELSSQESFSDFLFLEKLSGYITDENDDINEYWKKTASEVLFLTESDKWIVISVGEQIGTTDADGQISMLQMNKSMAENNLYEAREDFRIRGKMLRTLWGLSGLAAGIMII